MIISIWKSSQLRKKLCHFMIMVLSGFDLVTIVTNYPGILLLLTSWLKEDYDLLLNCRMYLHFVVAFLGFSFHVLLVMSIERYLGVYYPIFHRTSVTRRRLLTLLTILLIVYTTLYVIATNEIIIPRTLVIEISVMTSFLSLIYLNFKLFKISREVCQKKAISPEKRTTLNLKSISTCLLAVSCLVVLAVSCLVVLAVSCLVVLSISSGVYIFVSKSNRNSNERLSHIWGTKLSAVNCSLNSLIFFWKNNVLRAEGIKKLKTLKERLAKC